MSHGASSVGDRGDETRFATLVAWQQGSLRVWQVADLETMTVLSLQSSGQRAHAELLRLRRLAEAHWETVPWTAAGEPGWTRVRHEETLGRLEAAYRRFAAARLDAPSAACEPGARRVG